MDTRLDTANGSSTLALQQPAAKVPFPVLLLWACALAGLVVYTASWF